MAESYKDIELVPEDVSELLSRSPAWIIRWGSLCLLGTVVAFFLVSAFLKYPTVIRGKVTVTTNDQPVKIVSKVSGKIDLSVAENSQVERGQRLALVENTLSHEGVRFLRDLLSKTSAAFSKASPSFKVPETNHSFGYLQKEYNDLVTKLEDYNYFTRHENYSARVNELQKQIRHYEALEKITQSQLVLNTKALKNNAEKFNIDKGLYDSGVISRLDYLKTENEFIKQNEENEDLKKQIAQLNILESQTEVQLRELVFQFSKSQFEHRESIKRSLTLIQSSLIDWRMNFVLEAPISGKLHFTRQISDNQFVNANEDVFLIVPSNQRFVCIVDIPPVGFGKVKEGQRVRIKLDNYPSHEFGQLNGKVIEIPEIPFATRTTASDSESSHYRVLVDIDADNRTTYNKILTFKPEMPGTAEILTDELSLLERFLNHVHGTFDD